MSQEKIISTFNCIAEGYDRSVMRFFPFSADKMMSLLKPLRGQKVLDVATGTGAVAVAAAQCVGSEGRVTGIDLAEQMLERAGQNIKQMALDNVDLHVMDAANLEFKSNYFHAVTCSFGLFFIEDMQAALKGWKRVLRPGGKVMFSCFNKQAFQPMGEMLQQCFERHGIELGSNRNFSHQRLVDSRVCHDLMHDAGFKEINISTEQMGYHLQNAEEWWELLWNSGARSLIDKIPADKLEQFKSDHLKDIQSLCSDKGLWLDVETQFVSGIKPAE